MTTPHILKLCDAHDVDLVGGKAINLARLMAAGLPVPDGFVITTAAYREGDGASVSPELAAQITEAAKGMEGKLMAARSSATAEDMAGASMAGQYETCLNLETVSEVISGVETCWQSIRSDRILCYLNEHGIDPDQVAMAVVVQKLVMADVSGVLFTVDPKTGSREHMLIEATWGLGEGLVSGEVQPDVVSVRTDGVVESYDVATKRKVMLPGMAGYQSVKEEDQKRACLSSEQVAELRDLGRRAADHFSAPQDIEWAVEDGTIYLLQARPITTLADTDAYNRILADTKEDLQTLCADGNGPWVRHNLGETLPHPTPFTWEIVSQFMSGDGGFGKMHEKLGFRPGPAVRGRSFLKRVAGEVYMDCSLMTEMFAEGYPFRYDVDELRRDPDAAQNPPTIPNGSLSELGEAGKLAVAAAEKIDSMATDLDKRFDKEFVATVMDWVADQEGRELSKLGSEDLITLFQSEADRVLGEFGAMAFLPSMVEAVAMEKLRLLLEEHCWDDEPDEILAQLAVGQQPDCTMKANIALAQVGSGDLELTEWLKDYGHRAPGEFELATPRWSERPDDVQRLAGQMTGDSDIEGKHRERAKNAEACLVKLKGKFPSSVHSELIESVDLVQRYCRFREDGKFYLMKPHAVLRQTALEIGRRLGVGDNIFFLKPEEAFDALRSGFVPNDRIASRRVQYRVEDRIQLPHVIDSEDIAELGGLKHHADGPALKAHSVSCGSTTGPAAIVLSPESVTDLPTGAILICPSTDPSWTPLFVNASGLVLERGGSLSHGAVVAREMGLPAVVLEGATELLDDGESITVDANTGWVYREGAEAKPDPAQDTHIPRPQVPPSKGTLEGRINLYGLFAAAVWGIFLAAVYLLPEPMLHDPVMAMLDAVLWPLIRGLGMVGAVAAVAGVFGLLPIVMQRFLTDNRRLFEAKRRSGLLRKEAGKLPKDSPRRKRMEELATPVTVRILKAAMVPLAFILGPMIMVFMWFPGRVDPASWAADPGRMVSIVVEVDGECPDAITMTVPEPLQVDGSTSSAQVLPAIRKELMDLRGEWQTGSDMSDLPWEVRSAGDHTRQAMLGSLNAYLDAGIPSQKLTWLVEVPETAGGAHPVELRVGEELGAEFELVFGKSVPPPAATVRPSHEAVRSVTVNYPRSLQKVSFCAPFKRFGGPGWDLGWLGVYLLAYLPVMFAAKFALKVP